MEAPSLLADRWFRLLDGQKVTIGRTVTTLLVEGIHVDGDAVWVQLARSTQPASALLLRIRLRATVGDVFAALRGTPTAEYLIEVPRAA